MYIKTKSQYWWQYILNWIKWRVGNIDCYGAQITGDRETQQDSLKLIEFIKLSNDSKATLMVVADGMGGHKGGQQASQIVVKAFERVFKSPIDSIPEMLITALENSNAQIAQFIELNPQYENMGSTVIAAFITNQKLYWLSVGDSPLWLIRDKQITRLNADHSMLPVLVKMAEMGEISEQDIEQDPNRHVLRSVVNGKPIKFIDIKTEPLALKFGDVVLVASDGLQTLDEQEIFSVATQREKGSQVMVEELLQMVRQKGVVDQDNVSVVGVRLGFSNRVNVGVALVVIFVLLIGFMW